MEWIGDTVYSSSLAEVCRFSALEHLPTEVGWRPVLLEASEQDVWVASAQHPLEGDDQLLLNDAVFRWLTAILPEDVADDVGEQGV